MESDKKQLDGKRLPLVSAEELDAIRENNSFDPYKTGERLRAGDDWQRLLQAHLFFDHVLSCMITEAMEAPEHLRLDRTTFSAKLDLAAALGLLDDWLKTVLMRVNRLRNKIAHNLDFEITEHHGKELYDMNPPWARSLIDRELKRQASSRICNVLLVALTILEIKRQDWTIRRLHERRRKAALDNAMTTVSHLLPKIEAAIKLSSGA